MLEKEYAELIHYLKGMIADGVQLVHGGHLLDWEDTAIVDLLAEIDDKLKQIEEMNCDVGDLLEDRCSGQKAAVVYVNEDVIHMIPVQGVTVYPKNGLAIIMSKVCPVIDFG